MFCLYHECIWCPERLEENGEYPGTGFVDSCELSYG